MPTNYTYSKVKDEKLLVERGIGFEEIIILLEAGNFLTRLEHPNKKKYPNQFVYEIEIADYVYWVPCVINENEIFLKTIFPNRKATKKFKKGVES